MAGARRTSQNRLKTPSEFIDFDDFSGGSNTPESTSATTSGVSAAVADCIDLIVAIGDDRADEYMFECLEKIGGGQSSPQQQQHTFSRVASSHSHPPRSASVSTSIDAESAMERARDHDVASSAHHLIESPLPVSAYLPVLQYAGAPGASLPVVSSSSSQASPLGSGPASPEHMTGGGTTLSSAAPSSTTSQALRRRNVLTCTVGSKSSVARWFLPSAKEVVLYIDCLINGSTPPLSTATNISSILSPLQSPIIMARSSSSHPIF